MADPITVVQLVSASASLAMQCAQVAKGLHDLAGKLKNAELSILSTAHELDIIRLAWERIESSLQSWEGDEHSDKDLLQELRQKLDFGRLIVSSLADDLDAYRNRPYNFSQRTRYVWNEENLRGHQDRIRGQVAAMNLLVSVLKLPSAVKRLTLLRDSAEILRKADESAYSIVPSHLSSRVSSWNNDKSRSSIESQELIYHQLNIDDELFSARAYKRNYRNWYMKLETRIRPPVSSAQIQEMGLYNHAPTDDTGPKVDKLFLDKDHPMTPIEPDDQSITPTEPEDQSTTSAEPIGQSMISPVSDDQSITVSESKHLDKIYVSDIVISAWLAKPVIQVHDLDATWSIGHLREYNKGKNYKRLILGPAVDLRLQNVNVSENIRNLRECVLQSTPEALLNLLQNIEENHTTWKCWYFLEACRLNRIDLVQVIILFIHVDYAHMPYSVGLPLENAYLRDWRNVLRILCVQKPTTGLLDHAIQTCLMDACRHGWDARVEILLLYGLERLDLHFLETVRYFRSETARRLLRHGYNVNAKFKDRRSCILHVLLRLCDTFSTESEFTNGLRMASVLINHGADIAASDADGENFYHYAARLPPHKWRNHFACFLKLSIDLAVIKVALNSKSNGGESPVEIARRSSNQEFLDFALRFQNASAEQSVVTMKGTENEGGIAESMLSTPRASHLDLSPSSPLHGMIAPSNSPIDPTDEGSEPNQSRRKSI